MREGGIDNKACTGCLVWSPGVTIQLGQTELTESCENGLDLCKSCLANSLGVGSFCLLHQASYRILEVGRNTSKLYKLCHYVNYNLNPNKYFGVH